MMWNGYTMGGFGGLGMLIVALLVVGGIVWLLRSSSSDSRRNGLPFTTPGSGEGTQDRALEIARERLAKGEITPEEFESIKRGLSQ